MVDEKPDRHLTVADPEDEEKVEAPPLSRSCPRSDEFVV